MLYNTTNGQAHNNSTTIVAQQICHIALPEPNISTCHVNCQDVGIWKIFCPLVVMYKLQHVRIASVRVVESHTNPAGPENVTSIFGGGNE